MPCGQNRVLISKMTKSVRLFQPAVMTGFRRSQRHQVTHTALLKIKNVRAKDDTEFYLGKRVAFVFKGKNKVRRRSHVYTFSACTRHHTHTLAHR